MKLLTASILELSFGLSKRWGNWDMITVLWCLLRATLSMVCWTSLEKSAIVWVSMLLVPAANTVTSVVGICLMRALTSRAVRPGKNTATCIKTFPWTSGATPRTMELPITVTVIFSWRLGPADDVTVLEGLLRLWGVWLWERGLDCCSTPELLRSSKRLAVGTVIQGCSGSGRDGCCWLGDRDLMWGNPHVNHWYQTRKMPGNSSSQSISPAHRCGVQHDLTSTEVFHFRLSEVGPQP